MDFMRDMSLALFLLAFLPLKSHNLVTRSHSVPGVISFTSATNSFSLSRLSALVLDRLSSYLLYLKNCDLDFFYSNWMEICTAYLARMQAFTNYVTFRDILIFFAKFLSKTCWDSWYYERLTILRDLFWLHLSVEPLFLPPLRPSPGDVSLDQASIAWWSLAPLWA